MKNNILTIDEISLDEIKSYYECLSEISDNELFEGLLANGLFADKIPNFLSSEIFFNFVNNKDINFEQKSFLYIKYENMRNINIPRLLAIPNPFAYYKQCKILKENWDNLREHFKEKTKDDKHKISRIHIRKIFDSKKIFEMNYKTHKKDGNPEQKIFIGKKYLVKADISNCFPSIYTHSIAWALIGKEEAKKNKNKNNEWYNQIDKSTTWLNNNETHGLLIGPHTSNVISEIILVCVDNELSKKYEYIRNIDDYSCYVETKEKADQFLIDLSKELKKFDLSLNHKKTEIVELPIPYNNEWVRKLKLFKLEHYLESNTNIKKINYKDVCLLLDTGVELMKNNKDNAAILNYAIKILLREKMSLNAEKYFIDTIHHLLLIYPYLVILLEKIFDNINMDIKKTSQISDDIFSLGIRTNNYELMSYAIYFSLKYNFKLKHKNLIKEANKQEDCIFMLLCYLYDKKNLSKYKDKFKKYVNIAKKFIVDQNNIKVLNDEFWLFAYEVLKMEKDKSLQKCKDWKQLQDNDISFINFEKINLNYKNNTKNKE
ncbi:RNA-directed DNA polymerase [Campylobacter blaseri]|uniref:Reverse transcriptase domain-containing protein n=1 Tax=Campylobacter blaseri TaxID=2042961 RepID=A0A2P8QYY3_9BACT|nr:antiviral reverse transcriptase Drt4 [Campylobacter blaseri]PSM51442.1 hypothetical protein CQ405_07675 [Campylobacter blaseri]PSM52891.1 hypothetical protein CRN67_07680 [Campylobacter blaseri]QKF86554.1 RNA-directed DNA polymerase [Campylobacter blaseri]